LLDLLWQFGVKDCQEAPAVVWTNDHEATPLLKYAPNACNYYFIHNENMGNFRLFCGKKWITFCVVKRVNCRFLRAKSQRKSVKKSKLFFSQVNSLENKMFDKQGRSLPDLIEPTFLIPSYLKMIFVSLLAFASR